MNFWGKQVQTACPKEGVECTSTVASTTTFQPEFSADSEQFQEPNSDEVATPDSRPSTSSSGTRAIVQEQLRLEMALINADLVALYKRRAVGFLDENQEKELRLKVKKKKELEQTLKKKLLIKRELKKQETMKSQNSQKVKNLQTYGRL